MASSAAGDARGAGGAFKAAAAAQQEIMGEGAAVAAQHSTAHSEAAVGAEHDESDDEEDDDDEEDEEVEEEDDDDEEEEDDDDEDAVVPIVLDLPFTTMKPRSNSMSTPWPSSTCGRSTRVPSAVHSGAQMSTPITHEMGRKVEIEMQIHFHREIHTG